MIFTSEYDWSNSENPPAAPAAGDTSAAAYGTITSNFTDTNKYANPHTATLNTTFAATGEGQDVFIHFTGGAQTKLDYIVITCSNYNK